MTQQHVADALGLSLVHTNKTLARLRRMGMGTPPGTREILVDDALFTRAEPCYVKGNSWHFPKQFKQVNDMLTLTNPRSWSASDNISMKTFRSGR